ncbi:MAG: putative rane protein [Patescibacteria group bacterium]|nr:putative rane protein [Patescibacteria group bacterium]
MNSAIGRFLLRWFVCGLGLWIATAILGANRITFENGLGVLVVSGLLLAILNTVIKPIVVILSLPAILFSLGLFMIVINGLMVLLASQLYDPFHVENFGAAMLAGMIIGFVNYLVTTILDSQRS